MFKPWIGSNYDTGNSIPRTLILGESHYGDHHTRYGYELADKTIHNIEEQITQNVSYSYYTKLLSCFLGHKPNLAEKAMFWQGAAYHNLVTTPLLKPRLPPTDQQWQESLDTLPSVIQSLKPEYVVALGYRMWYKLASIPAMRQLPEIKDSGPCGVRGYKSSVFHGIMHPSGPCSPSFWYATIQRVKQQLSLVTL